MPPTIFNQTSWLLRGIFSRKKQHCIVWGYMNVSYIYIYQYIYIMTIQWVSIFVPSNLQDLQAVVSGSWWLGPNMLGESLESFFFPHTKNLPKSKQFELGPNLGLLEGITCDHSKAMETPPYANCRVFGVLRILRSIICSSPFFGKGQARYWCSTNYWNLTMRAATRSWIGRGTILDVNFFR